MIIAGMVANIFLVDVPTVKKWAYEFRDYVSETANPPKGETRSFTLEDLIVFGLVSDYWEDEPDYQHITMMLNSQEHLRDKYITFAYLNAPLLQDIPNNWDEPTRQMIIIGGMQPTHQQLSLRIAEGYRTAGDDLVRSALAADMVYEFLYPIFFMYRHAVEVYLKILVPEKNDTHGFDRLLNAYHAKYNDRLDPWLTDRLAEFQKLDPIGDTFRYADSRTPLPPIEYMLNLRQMQVVVEHICGTLRKKITKSDEA